MPHLRYASGAIVLLLSRSMAGDFHPPEALERLRAIGDTAGFPEPLRRAFDPGRSFQPITLPGPSDWLAAHEEPGQTFEQFLRSKPRRPEGARRKLYLLPLEKFREGESPPVDALQSYASLYFGLEVEVLPVVPLETQKLTSRKNPRSGNLQVLTGDVLALLKERLPADAFCLLAITMVDLYPEDSWNFVFGQALLKGRVGVFSFARYDPAFHGEERGRDTPKLLLRRSAKVLVHETAHMFGLAHCIYFSCVMNGSNNLAESDSRPLHLCPVCLRKLHSSVGFEVADRCRKLLGFYRESGLEKEALWMEGRLKEVAPGLERR